jgi:hypothetical protein
MKYWCLVQNFWMETPCMFKLSILHVWFKTFRWNLPLCSICKYFLSGSKLLDWITPSYRVDQSKFWTRHEVLTNWTYRKIPSESFQPEKLNIHGDSIQVLNQTWNDPVCSSCQYFMSGLKLLDGITLYVQIVWSSCLVQNFWMETPCMFSLSTSYLVEKRHEVLISWTYRVIPSKSCEPDLKYWQVEHMVWFNLKVLNQTRSTYKLNIKEDSI